MGNPTESDIMIQSDRPHHTSENDPDLYPMGFQDGLIPFWRFRGTMVVVGAGRGSLFRDCGWRGGALESRWPPEFLRNTVIHDKLNRTMKGDGDINSRSWCRVRSKIN